MLPIPPRLSASPPSNSCPSIAFVDDKPLLDKGLPKLLEATARSATSRPIRRYRTQALAGGERLREFKAMVKALPRGGDRSHPRRCLQPPPPKGNHLIAASLLAQGPRHHLTYRLVAERSREDYFGQARGPGTSLNMLQPQTLELVKANSLRYWVTEMHDRQIRSTSPSTLAQESSRGRPSLELLHARSLKDPVLSQVKLIAEEARGTAERDARSGTSRRGGQAGTGATGDAIRAFCRSAGRAAGELGHRLSGSRATSTRTTSRSPYSSVNLITAHDGFRLRDLANKYEHQAQRSRTAKTTATARTTTRRGNCGAEGETDSLEVRALRARQMRNMMATLLLSQRNFPRSAAGDEICRTQGGNNNAYCQDNEISWCRLDSAPAEQAGDVVVPQSRLIALRKAHPGLRRAKFFKGQRIRQGRMPRGVSSG